MPIAVTLRARTVSRVAGAIVAALLVTGVAADV